MTDRSRKAPTRKPLTPSGVLALPIFKTRNYRVWDTKQDGLGVRVLKSGVRTYVCAWNYPNGPTNMFSLGRVEDLTLDEARRRVADARRLAKEGLDPLAGDPKRTQGFKALFESFTKDQRAEHYTSADASEMFVLNACKAWHHRPVGTITWPEIKGVLSAKRATAPQSANRLHRSLARFFKWLVVNQVTKTSPMWGQPEPARAVSQQSREFDWLVKDKGDDAIKAIWAAADAIGGDEGRHLKLVMITGKRRSAVECMRWDDVGADWFWEPRKVVGGKAVAFGTRIKRCHPIPLPKLAQRILSPRQESGQVFGRLNERKTTKRVRELTGLDDFIFHAFRHLAETKCGELGVQPHIRDRLFDHSPGKRRGSGAGYDHGDYLAECTAALEQWTAHIARCVAPAEGVAVLR